MKVIHKTFREIYVLGEKNDDKISSVGDRNIYITMSIKIIR